MKKAGAPPMCPSFRFYQNPLSSVIVASPLSLPSKAAAFVAAAPTTCVHKLQIRDLLRREETRLGPPQVEVAKRPLFRLLLSMPLSGQSRKERGRVFV